MSNSFLAEIWYYYHSYAWRFILSILLAIVAAPILSTFGLHFLAIFSLIICAFLFLHSFLDIPKLFTKVQSFYVSSVAFYLLLAPIFIYCFSNVYREFGITHDGTTTHVFWDLLYFSTVTWTTLGYGDFRPTEDARIWAAAEAFIGYIYMGILVGITIVAFKREAGRYEKRPSKKYYEK